MTISDIFQVTARYAGIVSSIVSVVVLLACTSIAKAQGLAEVWTDKSTYAEGETIEVTLKVSNPDSTTYTWTTGCNAPTITFDDVELEYEACILFVEPFQFSPGAWRSWTYSLKPAELGIPRSDGSHLITVHFAHLAATTDVVAPRYVGGQVSAFVPTGANEDSVQTVVTALDATILSSYATDGGRRELWEIVGTTIDEAATEFQGPDVFLETSRFLSEYTTVATEPLEAGEREIRAVAYPTWFGSSATIVVDVGVAQRVLVEIFDVLGRRVSVLLDETLAPGSHTVVFSGDGLPAGRYLYRVVGKSSRATGFLIHSS